MLGSEVTDVERNLTKAVYVLIYKVDISCRILIILDPIRVSVRCTKTEIHAFKNVII